MPAQGFTPSSRLRLSRLGGTFVCLFVEHFFYSFSFLFFLFRRKSTRPGHWEKWEGGIALTFFLCLQIGWMDGFFPVELFW
jgi:hypothetical protein